MEPKEIYTDLGGGYQAFFQPSPLTNKSNLTRVTNFKKLFFSLKKNTLNKRTFLRFNRKFQTFSEAKVILAFQKIFACQVNTTSRLSLT